MAMMINQDHREEGGNHHRVSFGPQCFAHFLVLDQPVGSFASSTVRWIDIACKAVSSPARWLKEEVKPGHGNKHQQMSIYRNKVLDNVGVWQRINFGGFFAIDFSDASKRVDAVNAHGTAIKRV